MSCQSQEVHWHENCVDADERKPEVDFAEPFVQEAAEHFGEPEIHAREHSENCRHTHDQVKVRDHEISVVQIQIQGWLRQEESRKSAAHEQRYKSQGKQHGDMELNFAAPQRSQPIKR